MKNRHFLKTVRQRSCLAAGLVALVAIVGMAGAYYYKTAKTREDTRQEQMASDEETKTEVSDMNSTDAQNSGTESDTDSAAQAMTQYTADGDKSLRTESGQSIQGNVEQTTGESVANASASAEDVVETAKTTLNFTDTSEMDWPVRGDIILPYSMDKTVYFATLDQYKYNPAMLIAAGVNMKVTAAADEKITDVSANEDTGLTVTADLGNGYSITYGQLKEVELKQGDVVAQGDVIGYVAEPTKYYCVEGANLYLAMTKDANPVNPMTFLK